MEKLKDWREMEKDDGDRMAWRVIVGRLEEEEEQEEEQEQEDKVEGRPVWDDVPILAAHYHNPPRIDRDKRS